MSALLALFLLAGADAAPENANPIYRELRDPGLTLAPKVATALPAPTMPDGLNAKQQRAILDKLAGQDYNLDDLLRNSVQAPQVLKFRDISPAPPDATAHGVDLWFIAYGDLAAAANKDMLQPFLNANRKDTKVVALDAAALGKRGIKPSVKEGDEEAYVYASFPMLDRLQLNVTSRTYLTRSADTVLLAGKCDPRFAGDADYANQWRPIRKDDDGKPQAAPASPYEGFGYYVKITPLVEPKGALFVEHHLVFAEPKGWFNGANLIRSKLPLVLQSEVRSFRRELQKAKPSK